MQQLHTPGPFNPLAVLPGKVVKKILKLEFVKMAEISLDEEPELVPGCPPPLKRPPVTNISQWLEKFSLMVATLASHKREGPTTCLTFLGISIDTVAGEMRLPPEKLQRVKEMLRQWGDHRACSWQELESLIGLLNHACKVVKPGRSFLWRMTGAIITRNGLTDKASGQHNL